MFLSWRHFFSLIISVSVLVVGAFMYQSRTIRDSKVKSVEDYWAETGLGPGSLELLLDSPSCASSERYYLACVNSILVVASRYNLELDFQGNLKQRQPDALGQVSEKSQLLPWKQFFTQSYSEAMKVDFQKAWTILEEEHISTNQHPWMVGLSLNGFMSILKDPHTYLMPLKHFKEVTSQAETRSSNLGFLLGVRDGKFVLRKVLEKTPASEKGLKKGDILLAINGTPTQGLLHARVSELLKGEIGDSVKVTVLRDNEKHNFKLVRREVTSPNVSIQVIDGVKPLAVIGLNKFAKRSCENVREALNVVNRANVEGLLLDLRDNPGGYMEEAACIVSLFVGEDRKILEVRYLDRNISDEIFYGEEAQVFHKPVAVLVNSGSASAAEIVAGSLRDLNRAVIVGEKTFGKGSFQEGELWEQNKAIALFRTRGFYFLPSGMTPQNNGIIPDVAVDFDAIKILREEEQYMFPLEAPQGRSRTRRLNMVNNNCLKASDVGNSEDVQISMAKQVILCETGVARAAL